MLASYSAGSLVGVLATNNSACLIVGMLAKDNALRLRRNPE
jgi:hypothetical protein